MNETCQIVDLVPRCKTCRFFCARMYKCRRHAPQMIHWVDDEHSHGSITIINNFGKWPVIDDAEECWCGEWELNGESKEDDR